jgi:hypothetical protein
MKWERHRNLRRKPLTPAAGRGSIQRAIRRAFIASGAEALPSSSIYDWAYVRRRLGRYKALPAGIYSRALRTLRTMCDPVGRSDRVSGAPILWRLRNSAGAQTSPVLPGEDKKRSS